MSEQTAAPSTPSRPPRAELARRVRENTDVTQSDPLRVAYARRIHADAVEAEARGWTVITWLSLERGGPVIPHGRPPMPDGGASSMQPVPDYGAGVDGGYRHAQVPGDHP